jgi:hypothetical protein
MKPLLKVTPSRYPVRKSGYGFDSLGFPDNHARKPFLNAPIHARDLAHTEQKQNLLVPGANVL